MNSLFCFNIKATKVFAFVALLFYSEIVSSQVNLVNNPSFELTPLCHSSVNPSFWYYAGKQFPSYENSCFMDGCGKIPTYCCAGKSNFQYPRSGYAIIGISYIGLFSGNDFRNYLQTKLKDSLKIGKYYYTEFYVNSCFGSNFATNNVAALLTKNAYYVDTVATPYGVLAGNPQVLNYGNPIIYDTLNWVKVSAVFKALGGEQYLTLGNFKTNSQTNYVNVTTNTFLNCVLNIDDVALYELNNSFCLKADAGADTTIKVGDSIFIGSYTNGIDTIKWYNQSGQVIDSIAPGFWVKPTTNTTYYVEQIVNGCYTRDTINVTVNPLPLKFITFNVIPRNEESAQLNWHTANEINVSHYQIQRSTNAIDFETIGHVAAKNFASNEYSFVDDLKTKDQMPKTLFYRIVGIDEDGKKTYSITKSINIQNSAPTISIYPNPAKNFINIQYSNKIKHIKIINQLGQTIEVLNNNSLQQINNANQTITISTKQLAKGMYIIQAISINGKIEAQKVIVQ